ncbi:VQ motif-containing protein 25-like [Salvia miltiorrhiza]|uniref:VQ motif-containing protein 25-like n=1 Tax=Salvia miltiorrhiza TaxID=226208 RepID=UPI0025AD8036|nr:VQ motif-containing protein 25-like [Salvia miltiorrhiza]
MHRNSQTIAKTKPKIRIIHIFAPEIIKTDATNFRELVQRLTGKPTAADLSSRGGTKKAKPRKKEARIFPSSKKMEMAMRAGFHAGLRERERIKGEEEIWSSANSGGGFLGGFADFDGFMQEINHFPFLEGTTSQSMDVNGLSQLA